jgi:hypothetical protein
MVNKIKTYFETLEGLSMQALTDSAEKLVRSEKRNVALLIAHIAEMSRRRAACGYKNLFTYCVEKLHLSEGSVAMRIQVANVVKRFPQLFVALAENRISLTVAAHLAPHLREDNVEKLLSECAGMTKRKVEQYLVELRPKPVFNPSIRKRPSSKREAPQEKEQPKQPDPAASAEETPRQPPPTCSPNLLEPARTDVFNFRFSADEKFKAKFKRLAEVLGVENPLKNMAEVFEQAIDISLEKKDPKMKLERRLEKKRNRKTSREKSSPDEIPAEGEATYVNVVPLMPSVASPSTQRCQGAEPLAICYTSAVWGSSPNRFHTSRKTSESVDHPVWDGSTAFPRDIPPALFSPLRAFRDSSPDRVRWPPSTCSPSSSL